MFFRLDARNQARQRYCGTPACRKASKAQSQRQWLSKPENVDYFRDEENAARVRTWQAANPGYGKRRQRPRTALQDVLISEVPPRDELVPHDEERPLQDICQSQSTILVGLVAQLVGSPLQDSLPQILRRLDQRGINLIHGHNHNNPETNQRPPVRSGKP
jgi:hypothetical protein